MKVNFNIPFKNSRGEDAFEMVTVNGEKQKQFQMIDDIICQGLFDGRTLRTTGDDDADSKLKMRAFELYQKIRAAKGEVEITTEEASLIKRISLLLPPGAYGQIYQLIEGGK